MRPCKFCPRTRDSCCALAEHYKFWHSIPDLYASRLAHSPDRPVPEWLVIQMDERGSMLRQIPLPE